MNWEKLVGIDWATLVDGLANDINDSAESACADWHLNWGASIEDGLSSDETLCGVESDGAHVVASQMLGNFEHESVAGSLHLKGIENWGKLSAELHIHDGTNHLGDLSIGRRESSYQSLGYHVTKEGSEWLTYSC